jgi:hypothetical protein
MGQRPPDSRYFAAPSTCARVFAMTRPSSPCDTAIRPTTPHWTGRSSGPRTCVSESLTAHAASAPARSCPRRPSSWERRARNSTNCRRNPTRTWSVSSSTRPMWTIPSSPKREATSHWSRYRCRKARGSASIPNRRTILRTCSWTRPVGNGRSLPRGRHEPRSAGHSPSPEPMLSTSSSPRKRHVAGS